MENGTTAHNNRYTLRRLSGGSGLCSARSWLCHSHASLHPHFARPGLASQALIRAVKTSHTSHVKCKFFELIKICVDKIIENIYCLIINLLEFVCL